LLEGAERVEQRVTHGGRRRVEQVKLVDEDHHVLATEEGFAVGERKPLTKAICVEDGWQLGLPLLEVVIKRAPE
jgi:hypothetical protein